MDKQKIEILIPTFNEEKNITFVLEELHNEGYKNITILDANSSDKTVKIAEDFNCKIILDNDDIKGFGGSVINGLDKLDTEYFCIFDGDGSFNPKDIIEMKKKISEGCDFVFGSRYINGEISEDDDIYSKFGNFFFTKLVRILFRINTSDVLFLYVLGRKSNLRKIKLIQKDYSICSEFIIKAYKNFNCTEILSKERKRLHGHSKVNKILAGFTLLINIFKLRIFNK